MNKFASFIRDSAWTWGGAVIVLVTLSGDTRTIGLWISISAFVGQLVGFLLAGDE
jgi:hypothetical protein